MKESCEELLDLIHFNSNTFMEVIVHDVDMWGDQNVTCFRCMEKKMFVMSRGSGRKMKS